MHWRHEVVAHIFQLFGQFVYRFKLDWFCLGELCHGFWQRWLKHLLNPAMGFISHRAFKHKPTGPCWLWQCVDCLAHPQLGLFIGDARTSTLTSQNAHPDSSWCCQFGQKQKAGNWVRSWIETKPEQTESAAQKLLMQVYLPHQGAAVCFNAFL